MAVTVNYVAVLVAAVASFIAGWAWYSPMLFAKPWQKAISMTGNGSMKGMGGTMVAQFVSLLVTAYVLAHFVSLMNVMGTAGALQLAFWTWLGFVAMTMLGGVLFEKKNSTWFWITTGYHLVSIAIMALILTNWK